MSSTQSTDHMIEIPGLSLREAQIWQVLAASGPLNISQLATATNLHRPEMYKLLPILIEKGLVKETQDQRRVHYVTTGLKAMEEWCAARNEVLLSYFKEREAIQGPVLAGDDVIIYRGLEMRKVWETIIQDCPKKTVFYRYDGYGPKQDISAYVPKEYLEGMNANKLERFVVTNEGLRKNPYIKRIECASRMLPPSIDRFEQGISQIIFMDKIAMIDFSTETAFVIKNKALADYHAHLFRFVFNQLPE